MFDFVPRRVLLLAALLGCASDESPGSAASSASAAASAESEARAPLDRVAGAAIDRAVAAAKAVEADLDRRAPVDQPYRALRMAVAESAPFFRLRAQLGTEVLLGPPRAGDEGAGALGALDAALRDGNDKAARTEAKRVTRALELIDNEVSLSVVPPAAAMQALSDACFELGLLLLEASPSAGSTPEAVLADLRGTLAAITSGAHALAPSSVLKPARELASAFAAVKSASELRDRARLVRATGALGVELRRLARALGMSVHLPYRARYPVANNGIDESVTPFTLPAPRRDPRFKGDEAALAALGRALFFDKRLSRGDRRACSDCHRPDKAMSDGLPSPPSLDPSKPITRNTPTLLYAPLHAAQLWDGQFASAERQALKVIHTVSEMGLTADELERVVRGVPEYDKSFTALFDDGARAKNVARALVAYEVRELVPGNAPIDSFARGDDDALSQRDRAGLDVFASAGRCARCHVPPSFAGSRPTDFAVPVFAVLGVPSVPDGKTLDGDEGRAKVTKRPLDRGAFKTPTLRNASLTAPYFHHGRFATLEQVVDFYDKGGGRGIGLTVDNQDPDVRPLKLTATQKADLLLFMRTTLRDAEPHR